MRSHVIVIVSPRFDGLACFRQVEEDVLVEAFVAKFAVDPTIAFRSGLGPYKAQVIGCD